MVRRLGGKRRHRDVHRQAGGLQKGRGAEPCGNYFREIPEWPERVSDQTPVQQGKRQFFGLHPSWIFGKPSPGIAVQGGLMWSETVRRALADCHRAAHLEVPPHLLPPPGDTHRRYEVEKESWPVMGP